MSQYYLTEVKETGAFTTAQFSIDLNQEFYFQHAARYRGKAVIPGSFQIELVHEAFQEILNDTAHQKVELSNIHFQRVPKFLNNDLKLKVEIQSDENRTFQVKITSDLTDRNGRFLTQAVHSQMQVRILQQQTPPPPPRIIETDGFIDPQIPRALYLKTCPLYLGKYFDNVQPVLVYKNHRRSIYKLQYPLDHKAFASHITPPLLVDAMMQPVLPRKGDLIEVGIPKDIGQVRFYEGCGNDFAMSEQFPELHLISTVHPEKLGALEAWIVTPRGQVLCYMSDVEFTSLGFIDSQKGELVERLTA